MTCGSTAVCCDANNNAIPNCGPIDIDISLHPGDTPRLAIVPQNTAAPNGQLNVTVRARVKTEHDLIVLFGGAHCDVHLDTTAATGAGTHPDIEIDMPISLSQDPTAGTTNITANAGTTTVTLLDQGDFSFTPVDPLADFLCYGALFITPSLLEGQLNGPIVDALNGALCKSCPSGNVFRLRVDVRDRVHEQRVPERRRVSPQELGLDGRAAGSLLLGSISPGTTGALDLYEVAGGYSTTADSGASGLSLGLLGGMEPGGYQGEEFSAGPPATRTGAPVSVPKSTIPSPATLRPRYGDAVRHRHRRSQVAARAAAYAGYQERDVLLDRRPEPRVAARHRHDQPAVALSSAILVEEERADGSGPARPQSPPTIALGTPTRSRPMR